MHLQYTIPGTFAKSKQRVTYFLDILILLLLTLIILFAGYMYNIAWLSLIILFYSAVIRLLLDRDIYYPDRTFFYLLVIFIAAEVVSSIFSTELRESLFVVRRRAMLYIPFFASVMFIKNPKQLKKILNAFVVFTSFVSVLELIRYFTDPHLKTAPIFELRVDYFGHPVSLGEIKMLALIMICIFLLSKEKFNYDKIWLLLISIPILLSFYLTNSRGAALGLISAIVVIGFVMNRKLLYLVISAMILFLTFAPAPLNTRMLSMSDFSGRGIQSRFEMWKTSLEIAHDYPLLGIGSGDVINVYRQYTIIKYDGEGHQMHDNILHLLVTTGILGAAAWLSMMIYLFIRYIRIFMNTKNKIFLNDLALVSLASMTAFQVSGITDWNYGDFPFSMVLWIFLSFAFLAEKFNRKELSVKKG